MCIHKVITNPHVYMSHFIYIYISLGHSNMIFHNTYITIRILFLYFKFLAYPSNLLEGICILRRIGSISFLQVQVVCQQFFSHAFVSKSSKLRHQTYVTLCMYISLNQEVRFGPIKENFQELFNHIICTSFDEQMSMLWHIKNLGPLKPTNRATNLQELSCIGLRAQNMLTIVESIVNIIGDDDYENFHFDSV